MIAFFVVLEAVSALIFLQYLAVLGCFGKKLKRTAQFGFPSREKSGVLIRLFTRAKSVADEFTIKLHKDKKHLIVQQWVRTENNVQYSIEVLFVSIEDPECKTYGHISTDIRSQESLLAPGCNEKVYLMSTEARSILDAAVKKAKGDKNEVEAEKKPKKRLLSKFKKERVVL